MLVLLLIVFGAFFVADTYARFFTDRSENGGAVAAKWSVLLKQNSQALSRTFDFDLTVSESDDVASGKFAPSTSLEATLVLELTGTEVPVDYIVKADTSAFGDKLQSGDMTFTVYDNGSSIPLGKYIYVPLVGKVFTAENGVHTLRFVLSWAKDGDSVSDVDFAKNNASFSMPVSIEARQHTESDDRKVSFIYSETEESKNRETKPLNYTFDKQDILSDNPERGFYSTSLLKLDESGKDTSTINTDYTGFTSVKSNTSHLLHLKVDLSAFSGNMRASEDTELTAAAISCLEDVLGQIKQNDNTVILRFVYDNFMTEQQAAESGKTKLEPEQAMLLKHIEQLGPTFKKYATTINAVQVGFYGLWGECYYNTDAGTNGAAYYPQTVNALLNATSGTEITVAVRTVQYYDWYNAKGAHAEDARVGIFNDAYGASENDLGTYNRENETREEQTTWLGSRAEHTYYGGEAITDTSGVNGVGKFNTPTYFIPEAYKLHTSYLNWEHNQALHAQWAARSYTGEYSAYNDTALACIESHLGYRFVVSEVRSYNKASAGEWLPIDITVLNTGFGDLVKNKRCDVIITDSSGNVVHTVENVNINGKMFKSQTETTQSINITLPSVLSSGTYKVCLRMSSGETLDSGKYYSAVRFACDNMWNEALQANRLFEFEVE